MMGRDSSLLHILCSCGGEGEGTGARGERLNEDGEGRKMEHKVMRRQEHAPRTLGITGMWQ